MNFDTSQTLISNSTNFINSDLFANSILQQSPNVDETKNTILQQFMLSQNIFDQFNPEQRLRFALDTIQNQQNLTKTTNDPNNTTQPQQQQPIVQQQTNLNPSGQNYVQNFAQNFSSNNQQSLKHSNESTQVPSNYTSNMNLNNRTNFTDIKKVPTLFSNNKCQWPECPRQQVQFDSLDNFTKFHLDQEHLLDERSHNQVLRQMQLVKQIETEMIKQKNLLNDMLIHLNNQMVKQKGTSSDLTNYMNLKSNLTMPANQQTDAQTTEANPLLLAAILAQNQFQMLSETKSKQTKSNYSIPNDKQMPATFVVGNSTNNKENLSKTENFEATPNNQLQYFPRKQSERSSMESINELEKNRELYRNQDIRPPFTYASLIRQSIVESADHQLTLNEIYKWFEMNFSYFRKNAQTWKNAVRHNLSLHKCFMRIENVKGAVWTVDNLEYCRRRPLKTSSVSSSSSSQSNPAKAGMNSSIHMNNETGEDLGTGYDETFEVDKESRYDTGNDFEENNEESSDSDDYSENEIGENNTDSSSLSINKNSDNQENSSFFSVSSTNSTQSSNTRKLMNDNDKDGQKMKRVCLSSSNY